MCPQTPSMEYQQHPKFPLGKKGPFEQIRGNVVLTTLRDMAHSLDVHEHTDFHSEVETIRQKGDGCAITLPMAQAAAHHAHA